MRKLVGVCYRNLLSLGTDCEMCVVQSLTHVRFFETPWIIAHKAPLSFTICQNLLKLMSIESVMPSNHLIHCHTLLLLLLNLSKHQDLFQCVSSLHQLAKALELQLQHQSFQWISFRLDWFDLLAVQETLKNLLQHKSSKASFLLCSAFFMV